MSQPKHSPGSLAPRAALSRALAIGASVGLPLLLTGCNGAFVGNLFVLFMAFGIFVGTLGLGRNPGGSASASRPDASTDSRG